MSTDYEVNATFVQDTADSDGDGLTNYAELVTHSTNPNDSDSDDDGLTDEEEINKGTNPNLVDSDSDGVSGLSGIHRSDRSLRWQFHIVLGGRGWTRPYLDYQDRRKPMGGWRKRAGPIGGRNHHESGVSLNEN